MINLDFSFPHPVLGAGDDVDGLFESEVYVASDEVEVTFNVRKLTIENNYFKKLLIDGLIRAKLIIYCSSNLSTLEFEINEGSIITVNETKLINSVTISTILVANTTINDYKDKSFHIDYEDSNFTVDRNSIVGVTGTNTVRLLKSDEKLTLGSIFTFVKHNDEKMPITFNFNQDQINVIAPTYQQILPFKYIGENFMWTAMNIYVLPALSKALELSEKNREKFKHLRWFQVLETIFPYQERQQERYFEDAQELLMRVDKNNRLPSANNLLELRNE